MKHVLCCFWVFEYGDAFLGVGFCKLVIRSVRRPLGYRGRKSYGVSNGNRRFQCIGQAAQVQIA